MAKWRVNIPEPKKCASIFLKIFSGLVIPSRKGHNEIEKNED
jgi:hypothetical protein